MLATELVNTRWEHSGRHDQAGVGSLRCHRESPVKMALILDLQHEID